MDVVSELFWVYMSVMNTSNFFDSDARTRQDKVIVKLTPGFNQRPIEGQPVSSNQYLQTSLFGRGRKRTIDVLNARTSWPTLFPLVRLVTQDVIHIHHLPRTGVFHSVVAYKQYVHNVG